MNLSRLTRALKATGAMLATGALFFTPLSTLLPVAQASAAITIHSCEQLQNIGADPELPSDGNYKLAGDISCWSSEDWGEGDGFNPIGSVNDPFTGTFNGQGYSIKGLTINRPMESNIGLFASLDGATVEYLNIDNATIDGQAFVGALAGRALGSTSIRKVSVTFATVSAVGNESGEVSIGGLLGNLAGNTQISDVLVQGEINSYYEGSARFAGGLVGITSSGGSIDRAYFVGRLLGAFSSNDAGPLVGNLYYDTEIGSMFWNSDRYAQGSYANGTTTMGNSENGRTTVEMRDTDIYTEAEWDFETVWDMQSEVNNDYPFLRAPDRPFELLYEVSEESEGRGYLTYDGEEGELTSIVQTAERGQDALPVTAVPNDGYVFWYWYYEFENDEEDVWEEGAFGSATTHQTDVQGTWYLSANFREPSDAFAGGEGTEESPYEIATCEQLDAIRELDSAMRISFVLISDIDCSGMEWEAIYDNDYFSSTMFDGSGFTISGLTDALFEYYSGTVTDLTIKDTVITASGNSAYYFGVLADHLYGGASVSDVSVSGSITVESNDCAYLGGLAAEIFPEGGDISITRSSADVDITAGACNRVGGFVAGISSQYASEYVVTISDSYARGDVVGEGMNVGGFLGELGSLWSDSLFRIERVYASGKVAGSDAVGGLIGYAWEDYSATFEVSDSFWDIESSEQATSAFGEGRTTAQMKTTATFTDAGWDFSTVWSRADTMNDGYPYLSTQVLDTDEEAIDPPPAPAPARRSGGGSRATAPTASASIAALQAQLEALQAQLAALRGEATGPITGVRDLESGMQGEDVRALQTLLIGQGHAIPAGATGFFANQTQAALAAYQTMHSIVPAIGYFGAITRAQMKSAGLGGLWW